MYSKQGIQPRRLRLGRRSHLPLLGLALGALTACSAAPDDRGNGEEANVGTAEGELARWNDPFLPLFTTTTNYTVTVCFRHSMEQGVSPSPTDMAKAKESVRTAIEMTWGAVTRLRFLGWNDCPASPDWRWVPIVLRYSHSADSWGLAQYGVGGRLSGGWEDGNQISMGVPPDRRNLGRVAVHEMGHALGFIHEHQRVDAQRCPEVAHTNVSCTSNAACAGLPPINGVGYICDLVGQNTNPGYGKCILNHEGWETFPGNQLILETPYDLQSVTSYCNPVDPNPYDDDIRDLTSWDIYGAQKLYGKRTTAFQQLVTWYKSSTVDFATSEAAVWGYKERFVDGWLYSAQAPGTVAVDLYYSAAKDDYALVGSDAIKAVLSAPSSGYAKQRTVGYGYPTQQVDPATGQALTVPLALYFSNAAQDTFTTASPAGHQYAAANNYTFVNNEVHVLPKLPYTVLFSEKSNFTGDQILTSDRELVGNLRAVGYASQRFDGLILRFPVPGTAALKQFYHPSKQDFFATGTAAGEASAALAQYEARGREGYVFTSSFGTATTGTSPMDLWWHATNEDSHTTVQRVPAAGSGYVRVRTEGYAFNAGQ